jgi:hypothetical protein
MELRQQLAMKITEASTTQGHEGNGSWIKRQIWEEHDTTIQLHEAQRILE